MRQSQNTVSILTGPGKLHLIDAARALAGAGWSVRVIGGWMPGKVGLAWVDLAGRMVGQPSLRDRLAPRRNQLRSHAAITECTTAEVMYHALLLLARTGLLSEGRAASLGFRGFGHAAARKLLPSDIFHVRSGAGQGGVIQKARRNGSRVVVDHSIAHPNAIFAALSPEYERYGLRCPITPENPLWDLVLRDCDDADVVLVNSEYVKRTFIEHGFPRAKLAVAYLGVRSDFLGAKQHYERSGPVKLLFTGHFDLRKGARTLLDACEILKHRRFPFTLDVIGFVGSGCHALRGRALSDVLELKSFVTQDTLKAHLANADIFVFPTLAEGSSRSAMEAMGVGLPVITTEACGVPIEDGISGIYVRPGDAEQLADAIERLANDRNLRRQLGTNACERIRLHYSWTRYAEAVSLIYNELLGVRPCPLSTDALGQSAPKAPSGDQTECDTESAS